MNQMLQFFLQKEPDKIQYSKTPQETVLRPLYEFKSRTRRMRPYRDDKPELKAGISIQHERPAKSISLFINKDLVSLSKTKQPLKLCQDEKCN